MKEAVSETGGKENATQLLTQYGLLSNGLGSTTSSEDDREPQPQQPAVERASEAEAEQIVSQHPECYISYHYTHRSLSVTSMLLRTCVYGAGNNNTF